MDRAISVFEMAFLFPVKCCRDACCITFAEEDSYSGNQQLCRLQRFVGKPVIGHPLFHPA